MKNVAYQTLKKRLLFIAISRGMVFWYAIEKLYYLQGGVTLRQVVYLGMFSQLAKIAFELPTSVFADRWSRRNTLLASAMTMIASTTLMGFSSSLTGFAFAIAIWSLSDSLRSGVDEAFIYDSLKQHGWQKHYRRIQARMSSVEWIVMTVASLFSAWFGHIVGLHIVWFLTTIPYMVYATLLLGMSEPPIARTQDRGEGWWRHLSGAVRIMHQREIRWSVLLSSVVLSFTLVWYSNYQLIGIDIAMPEALFGVLISALTLGQAFGAELSHSFAGTRKWLAVSWIGLVLAMLVGLRFTSTFAVLFNFFVLLAVLRMLRIYLEVFLHDRIPSERRATIFSLTGMVSYVWYFLLAGAFSLLIDHFGIRQASTMIFMPVLILIVVDFAKGLRWATDKRAPFVPAESDHVIN